MSTTDSSVVEANAAVFWTAFSNLPQQEQRAVLRRVISDERMRHDLMDLAVIEERRSEPQRPLREYLDEAGTNR
jgi:hypothetical protein